MIDRDAAEKLMAVRLSPRRAEHSRRVAATAAAYAQRWGASCEAAEVAGLLHDLWRDATPDEILAAAAHYGVAVGPVEAQRPVGLLHAPVAAAELRVIGLDEEIVSAIALHTVGRPGMTALEKCVYLADLCEPARDFEGLADIRRLVSVSLDAAVAAAAQETLLSLIRRGHAVVPAALELYNGYHVRG